MQMSKGYWVIECQEITNHNAMQKYVSLWSQIANEFDAKVIAGTQSTQVVEGPQKARVLIIEFASFQIAQNCYYSEKYQEAKVFALEAMQRNFFIIEGN